MEPKRSIWEKYHIKCPEQRGEADLFLEWSLESGSRKLISASCNNEQLLDLSGKDCEWSCWDTITE